MEVSTPNQATLKFSKVGMTFRIVT